jgi:hypothetical protein
MREVVNALIDVRAGCRWRAIAKDLAARRTEKDSFIRWNHDGTRDRIPMRLREIVERKSPKSSSFLRGLPDILKDNLGMALPILIGGSVGFFGFYLTP